jgi:hypothetical protein
MEEVSRRGSRVDTPVTVRIAEAGADGERVDELTRALRTELIALDVGDVRLPPGEPPPPGTRAVDVATIGALIVLVNGSAELLTHVATLLSSWVGRGSVTREVELTVGSTSIRISSASQAQQDRLVEEFVRAVRQE